MSSENPTLFPMAEAESVCLSDATLASLLPKLRAFLAQRISNGADVEDVAQEILLRVHRGASQLSDETRINGWIWQIARNAVIEYYRGRNSQGRQVALAEDPIQKTKAESMDKVVAGWLAPMIAALPDPYREAVTMSEIEGLTQTEVAEQLSISLSGAKSRVQRGRAKLREALLACCRFEFDREGRIIGYEQIGSECVPGNC